MHRAPFIFGWCLQIAINKELMVAICNSNLAQPGGALEIWSRNINRANISNAMVVALDDETETFCKAKNMTVIRMPPVVSCLSFHKTESCSFTASMPCNELTESAALQSYELFADTSTDIMEP